MSVVDGGCIMYPVKQIFKLDEKILLPTCMYYVKNIHFTNHDDQQAVHLLEDRQEEILSKLEQLKSQLQSIRNNSGVYKKDVIGLKQEIVIRANPKHPPYSTLILLKWMQGKAHVGGQSLFHSSVRSKHECLKRFFDPYCSQQRSACNIYVTLIWTNEVDVDPLVVINPIAQVGIRGDVNILRYLCNIVKLDSTDACEATAIDAVLDQVHGSIVHGSNKDRQAVIRQFNARLGKHSWLAANSPTIADLAAWGALRQCDMIETAPASLKKWAEIIEAF